jgi:uncharacterized protein YjiS (DUF1127 family)
MTDFTAAATLRSPTFAPIAALRAWLDTRRTERALSKLSDRELDDIGLTRGDINDIARGGSVLAR